MKHISQNFCRFPKSVSELDLSPDMRLLCTSTYTFTGVEGSLSLSVIVKDGGPDGNILFSQTYEQKDQIERKYGVTFNKDHKYEFVTLF